MLVQHFVANDSLIHYALLLSVLAIQHHINEYVQHITEAEKQFMSQNLQRYMLLPVVSIFLVIALFQTPTDINSVEVFVEAVSDWWRELLTIYSLNLQQEGIL